MAGAAKIAIAANSPIIDRAKMVRDGLRRAGQASARSTLTVCLIFGGVTASLRYAV